MMTNDEAIKYLKQKIIIKAEMQAKHAVWDKALARWKKVEEITEIYEGKAIGFFDFGNHIRVSSPTNLRGVFAIQKNGDLWRVTVDGSRGPRRRQTIMILKSNLIREAKDFVALKKGMFNTSHYPSYF